MVVERPMLLTVGTKNAPTILDQEVTNGDVDIGVASQNDKRRLIKPGNHRRLLAQREAYVRERSAAGGALDGHRSSPSSSLPISRRTMSYTESPRSPRSRVPGSNTFHTASVH